jgi:hypothetical protein
LNTPGFLENGIDFEQLVKHYINNKYNIEITDPIKIKLAKDLMNHVINNSYGYNDYFSCTQHGRFQMIFNSTLEELENEKAGLIKRSNAIWTLNGKYETGTDFLSANGAKIEAKVYKNKDSMLAAANAGTLDYKVFHGAAYVICYLIEGEVEITSEPPFRKIKHWFWLRNIDGKYDEYTDSELTDITNECLPKTIPICQCKFYDDKISISKNNYYT